MRKTILFLSLSVAQASTEPGALQFREGAAEAGIEFHFVSGSPEKPFIIESISGGVALFDYDNDGWLDVYLVNGNTLEEYLKAKRTVRNALYRNQGDGAFRDVTLAAGVSGGPWDMGVVAADVDNDGFQDLFLTGFDRNTLFRNNGDGTFTDVTVSSGLSDKRWGAGAAFGDFDADGLLDLYVARYVEFDPRHPPHPTPKYCSYRGISVQCGPRGMPGAEDSLYRNLGGGHFRDVSREAGIRTGSPYYGLGCIWFDYDNDGDQDIFVANDSCPNFLFRNDEGRFVEVAMESGVALGENGNEQDGMGIAVGDVNRDGRLDLVLTNFSEDNNTLYLNRGSFFTDSSYRWGLGETTWQYLGWGTFFFDGDLDGWLDLFVANGHVYPQVDNYQIGTKLRQRDLVFHNEGGRRLLDVGRQAGLVRLQNTRGAAAGDLNNDGKPDIVVNHMDSLAGLYWNETATGERHWIGFDLTGSVSNRDGVGARVTVSAGGLRQVAVARSGSSYLSHNDHRLLFGTGDHEIDEVTIRWPSGRMQTLKDWELDAYNQVTEPRVP